MPPDAAPATPRPDLRQLLVAPDAFKGTFSATVVAAAIGRGIEPMFAPLGFDWRVNVGIVASLSARETFVATLGQIATAENPDHPATALAAMTYTDGPNVGLPVFSAPTIAALLVFFVYALQCISTVAVLRRESNSWRWPLFAFSSMWVLAWTAAYLARLITIALTG